MMGLGLVVRVRRGVRSIVPACLSALDLAVATRADIDGFFSIILKDVPIQTLRDSHIACACNRRGKNATYTGFKACNSPLQQQAAWQNCRDPRGCLSCAGLRPRLCTRLHPRGGVA